MFGIVCCVTGSTLLRHKIIFYTLQDIVIVFFDIREVYIISHTIACTSFKYFGENGDDSILHKFSWDFNLIIDFKSIIIIILKT